VTDVGDLRRLTFALNAPGGWPASSDSMTLTITQPDATAVMVSPVVAVEAGRYQYDFLATQPGRHVARWVGTGANPGATVEAFDVIEVSPYYMFSVQSAKNQLRITDDSADEELREYIAATTYVVERIKGEAMVRRSFTEEHEISATTGRAALSWTPVVSLTSVTLIDSSVTWDPSSLHVNSETGVVSTTGISGLLQLAGRMQFVYVAGHSVIPANRLLAGRIILKHLWQTNRGTKGAPRSGDDTAMVPGIGYAIPNRALELLGSGLPGFA
jgi:hypothetical protein